jgi:hypothetical protein
MCKVLAFTNLSKVKNLNEFTETVAKHITKSERDGFGYAIQGKHGLFGERTINPSSFRYSMGQETFTAPYLEQTYNQFGKVSKPAGAGIFHGRTSTNLKSLVNTHPIERNRWFLIHNGVVSNHGAKYEMHTSNDTEHLVHYLSTGGITEVARQLTGYYACAAFSPDGRLHIFRDVIAPLVATRIPKLDTVVFGTNAALIQGICSDLKLEYSNIEPMFDNQYVVFFDNQVELINSFCSRGYEASEAGLASKSLGRELEPNLEFEVYNAEGFTDDEACFLEEMRLHADHTYTILDYRENRMELDEFLSLSPEEQIACTAIRPDGTVVDPADYYTEKIYHGRIA